MKVRVRKSSSGLGEGMIESRQDEKRWSVAATGVTGR